MLKRMLNKIQEKKGSSTLEFVICMLIFVMVTAFIVDLFVISYKHYVISANCTKAVRVLAIQGGIDNTPPDNFPGGNPNYMSNLEFRNYLNGLSNTVQGDPGSMKVYLDYSYIDNSDNVIEKKDLLIYEMKHDKSGTVSTTYYPQSFLLPYGSFITLRIEYTYQFFYTDIWFDTERYSTFNSSKSCVTEYVSYDYSYHIEHEPILTVSEDLPIIETSGASGDIATDKSYFTYSGNAITGLSEAGKAAGITDLVIPTEIDGVIITQIADHAFDAYRAGNECCANITSVLLPNTIKVIRRNAFFRCSGLVSVRYYEGLYEGVEQGLERIDEYAFASCTNLKSFVPAYHYTDPDQIPGLTTPPRIIFPKSLKEIGTRAFIDCSKIEIIRIGENVVKIEDGAFEFTNAQRIYIDKPEDTISGAPWKNTSGTTPVVEWNQPRVGD